MDIYFIKNEAAIVLCNLHCNCECMFDCYERVCVSVQKSSEKKREKAKEERIRFQLMKLQCCGGYLVI